MTKKIKNKEGKMIRTEFQTIKTNRIRKTTIKSLLLQSEDDRKEGKKERKKERKKKEEKIKKRKRVQRQSFEAGYEPRYTTNPINAKLTEQH